MNFEELRTAARNIDQQLTAAGIFDRSKVRIVCGRASAGLFDVSGVTLVLPVHPSDNTGDAQAMAVLYFADEEVTQGEEEISNEPESK